MIGEFHMISHDPFIDHGSTPFPIDRCNLSIYRRPNEQLQDHVQLCGFHPRSPLARSDLMMADLALPMARSLMPFDVNPGSLDAGSESRRIIRHIVLINS